MNTVNVCRMRERIEQDARTSLLMRERTHIVHWGSFLLTWINCNPSIASSLPSINYKVWQSRRSLAMATYFNPTL